MSAWARNRATIQRLMDEGRLEMVQPASLDWAAKQLDVCDRHLESARRIDLTRDPEGAVTLAYDAARKASAALLEAQGLRATAKGAHATIAEAVDEQFGGPFGRLNRYRRIRNTVEYPTPSDAGIDAEVVQAVLQDGEHMVDAARRLLESGQLTPWRS